MSLSVSFGGTMNIGVRHSAQRQNRGRGRNNFPGAWMGGELRQLLLQIANRLPAAFRFLFQTPVYDFFQRSGGMRLRGAPIRPPVSIS